MILGAEIGMLVYGLYVLVAGKYSLGKGRVVTGGKARILGVLCLLPIPLAFAAGLALGLVFAIVSNEPVSPLITVGVEIAILVVIALVVIMLGNKFYNDQEREAIPATQSYIDEQIS